MNNWVFGKTMENVGKNIDIKLATTEKRRNYIVSEPNYNTTISFSKHWLKLEMKKTQICMSKAVHLGLSILELSTTVV